MDADYEVVEGDRGGDGMNECPTCGRRMRGSICPYCDEEVLEEEETDAAAVTGEDLIEVSSLQDAGPGGLHHQPA